MFLKIFTIPQILKRVGKKKGLNILITFLGVILVELTFVIYYLYKHIHRNCNFT